MSTLQGLGQGGGSPSRISVKATGGTVYRSLADHLADIIDVRDYGAKIDGVTDDTDQIQAADDYASSIGASLWFPDGTGLVRNISKGTAEWNGTGRRSSIIKAHPDAVDNRYLIASPAWINGGIYASSPTGIYSMGIDANGDRERAVVIRSYFTKIKGCEIYGSTDTDLMISTDAADGTALSGSTMVNNVYDDNWLGRDGSTAQYNFRLVDSLNKATDHHLTNNFISGATVMNVGLRVLTAGWDISGNHVYGAPISIEVGKPNVGTLFARNYFEGDVHLHSGGAGYETASFGPGNYFAKDVYADFENNSVSPIDTIIMAGNVYSAQAHLRHAYADASKKLISVNETFRNSAPFEHYSVLSPSTASAGIYVVKGATVAGISQTISAAFVGSTASVAGIPARPSDLLTNPTYADRGSLGWHHKTGHLTQSIGNRSMHSTNSALSLSVVIPTQANNGGFRVNVSLGQRLNHSSTVRTTFSREYSAVKRPADGLYYLTTTSETYSSGEWTIAPSVAATDDGNGNCTVTFTGTPATTDGYGNAFITVSGF